MKALILGDRVLAHASDGYAKAVLVLGDVNAVAVDIMPPHNLMLPPDVIADVDVLFCMIDDLRHRGYPNENYRPLIRQIMQANPKCRAIALYRDEKRYFKGRQNPDMSDKYFNGQLNILYSQVFGSALRES